MISGNYIRICCVKKLIFCILLFSYIVGFILGFILCDISLSVDIDMDGKTSVIEQVSKMTTSERFFFIAENNVIIGVKCFIGGLLTLGVYPIVSNMYSAFMWGSILGRSLSVISIKQALYSTLPHSFEVIGIIGMGYLGTMSCISLLQSRLYLSYQRLFFLLILFLFIIVVSAFIETYVSMSIL